MHFDEIQIRDPIHGTVQLSKAELRVIDHPAAQRLRWIKQLGLADHAYPGATHSRYSHAIGTLHVASRMFDRLARDRRVSGGDATRLKTVVRLAATFHDLGHAPLSHATEAFMPPAAELDLGDWAPSPPGARASHEDYTLKILTDSDLTDRIRAELGPAGVSPEDVAALLRGRAPDPARFHAGGTNWFYLLRQCVSSELDADRMDYLLRDSYYAGVPYGRYDLEWLLENLLPIEVDGRLHLGLQGRATFGFEDYLLSRYHMFLSVYLHHVPVAYEIVLARLFDTDPAALALPASVAAYLKADDVQLYATLRELENPWARRLVERRAFRRLAEVQSVVDDEEPGRSDVEDATRTLQAEGIDAVHHDVKGRVSKYFSPSLSRPPLGPHEPDVFVATRGHPVPIEAHTPLYRRYRGALRVERIYVLPEQYDRAKTLLRRAAPDLER